MSSETMPLILTLKLDESAFEFFDSLRKQYFPPERNFIPAHVTLFHHLPGEHAAQIKQDLTRVSQEIKVLKLQFPRLRFLGKGCAAEIECPPLNHLRARLAAWWKPWLGAQDSQKGYRPHITIQNKVQPEAAKQLFETLSKEWQPLTAQGEGLLVWQYLGGPWRLCEEYDFIGFQ